MAQRCRLTATAQIDGAVRAPGYEFVLGDGERGPHRTVRPVNPSINASHVAGHDHTPDEGEDEALYEVIGDVAADSEQAAAPSPPSPASTGEGAPVQEPAAPSAAEADPRDPT